MSESVLAKDCCSFFFALYSLVRFAFFSLFKLSRVTSRFVRQPRTQIVNMRQITRRVMTRFLVQLCTQIVNTRQITRRVMTRFLVQLCTKNGQQQVSHTTCD